MNNTIRTDFNGDGFDDLAIGVPGEAIGSVQGAGAVHILYGSAAGLGATRSQLWHRNVNGVPGDAVEGERFGSVLATGDFNRDGFADLVMASPSANGNTGSLLVLFGSGSGLTVQNHQVLQPAANEIGIFFGAALAAGDFNGDEFDDLAVGVPGADLRKGAVAVFPGSSEGLRTGAANVVKLTKSQIPAIPGDGRDGDFFGKALAAGDFNKDNIGDLAIGIPEQFNFGSGMAVVVFGTRDGLKPSASQVFTQNTDLVQDQREASDRFGLALVAGDLDGNGSSDLIIAVPGENSGGKTFAGAVAVLYGFTGLSTQRNQLWHQDSPGIGGAAEANDEFGRRLAVGDFDGDGFFDVAIGVPGEDLAGETDAGVIHVLYGSADSLTANRSQLWHHDSPDIARAVEPSERFGAALGVGDFNGDGFHDLVVGIPGEGFAGVANAGGITVLYGSRQGLRALKNQFWYQDSNGVAGGVEAGDLFGSALSGGDADSPF